MFEHIINLIFVKIFENWELRFKNLDDNETDILKIDVEWQEHSEPVLCINNVHKLPKSTCDKSSACAEI